MDATAKDLAARLVSDLHRALDSVSRGRVGGRGLGLPVVQLATVGRQSGKRRTTMLTAPVTDGDPRPQIVEAHPGHGQYQTRTERDIPVVIVEPLLTLGDSLPSP